MLYNEALENGEYEIAKECLINLESNLDGKISEFFKCESDLYKYILAISDFCKMHKSELIFNIIKKLMDNKNLFFKVIIK